MSQPLSLVEAFRSLAFRVGDSGHDDHVREAAVVLLPVLRDLARKVDPQEADEISSIAMMKLLRTAGSRPALDDETAVRAYLKAVLRNAWLDLRRRSARSVAMPSDEELVRGEESPLAFGMEEELDRARFARAIAHAVDHSFPAILEKVAGDRRGPGEAAFRETIERLQRIAAGATTVNDWVDELAAERGGSSSRRQIRNSVDQRITRALRQLNDEIQRRHASREIGDLELDALGVVIDRLRPGGRS